jgi:predicted RNA polymerase sigma factor
LRKLGQFGEARTEIERAASLTQNARERELLLNRARACALAQESASRGGKNDESRAN